VDPARLRSFPLFATLSDEECLRLVPLAYELTVPAGQRIVGEGEQAWEFFGLLEGTAAVRRGEEVVARLGPGSFFGEIALLESVRRIASVDAESDVRLLIVPSEHFETLVESKPDLAERIRSAVRRRTHATLGAEP
jgi:CRP-like cAMP-binding protein